ncbi:MAG: SMP-30/gluconolactonase/LRE family protein [Nocardioidaceae bacterium]|nr:SMP-30/gluconolactonase/LRE family protein [Nocardioidaceae bacterium]
MIPVVAVTEPWFALAEGPVWDAAGGRVLWIDIPEGLVLVGRLVGDHLAIETQHHFDSFVGAVALAADGSLLVAETYGLTCLQPDGTRIAGPTLVRPENEERLNDATCDAHGRLLVGTLSLQSAHHSQRLIQIGAASVEVLDDDLGLSNGLAFSPDGTLLYSVDSIPGTVWVRDYDQGSGAVGPRRLVLLLGDGTPDGMCADASGNLWIAIWGRGQVRCFSPAGKLLDTITVPAPHTSSVAFVGSDLDQLLITTARTDLSPAQLDEFPQSGSLFLARPGCVGLPTHLWSPAL